MTKRQFIWLVIRFVGFAYVFAAVQAVLVLANSIWNLIEFYPYEKASSYFVSYLLFNQAAASTATILITAYMLLGGKFVHRMVDKSTSFVAEDGLDTRNYAEIMIRFVGVYFLWGILARLGVAVYSALMLARFKHAPQECIDLVAKNEMLSQHFKNLQSNLTTNSLLGLVILAGLAFYFLRLGKLVIDLFHHRWLSGETKAASVTEISNSDSSPSESN